MKGLISKATIAGCLAAGLISAAGCYCSWDDLVDPCWPQRYNAIAREEVREPIATQASNGLDLEQTVYNHYFLDGKATLHPMGEALLNRLARRRPAPVDDLYVQTAHDIKYDAAKPEQYLADKTKLDQERVKAVQTYLGAVRPDVTFSVAVSDPSAVGMQGVEAAVAVRKMIAGSTGGFDVTVTSADTSLGGGVQQQYFNALAGQQTQQTTTGGSAAGGYAPVVPPPAPAP